jgi:hypothetical protein
MTDRPYWNLPAVSPPSPDEVIAEIAEGKGPSPATQSLVKSETTPMLYDQNHAPVPARGRGFSGLPDWNFKEQPRDEQGQFVSKSEGELRQQWDKEGGLAQVAQTVMRKEAAMVSVVPSLEAKIATLDKGFLVKAADHLRLGVSYGPDGFWRSVAQFEDSLSPSEKQTWANWLRGLDDDEKSAMIYGMTK